MELIQQLYSSESYIAQQTTAIEQALTQMNGAEIIEAEDSDPQNENLETTENNQVIIDKLEDIKSSSVVYGKKDARFTILEYSELLCPYCKRHSDQGTLESIVEKYPDDVNTVFRNFIVHQPAAKL
jgi:protein-disulfide isomerase